MSEIYGNCLAVVDADGVVMPAVTPDLPAAFIKFHRSNGIPLCGPCCLCRRETPGYWYSGTVEQMMVAAWEIKMHEAQCAMEREQLFWQRPFRGWLCLKHWMMTEEDPECGILLSEIIERERSAI